MAAAPMADRLRAESQGKIQNLAGVVARAADFHQVPSRSKVGGTHFRVGFEAAGRQNNRTAMEVGCSFSRLHADASDLAFVIDDEPVRSRFVKNFDAFVFRSR